VFFTNRHAAVNTCSGTPAAGIVAKAGLSLVVTLALSACAVSGEPTEQAAQTDPPAQTATSEQIWATATHGYADNNGVKIHYATVGEGPLVVMIHGFPDFWYSWRHQMAALQEEFQVVAIDQRGYNKSDAPSGEENYNMRYLVSDVAAVIESLGARRATIVGHDWGGAVAWNFAFAKPEMVENLIVLNLPHPKGMATALANSATARANTSYAQKFRSGSPSDPDIMFGGPMTPETLSGWVTDQAARAHYKNAFKRSSYDAMLAYYKQNYPPAARSDGSSDSSSDEDSERTLPQTPQLAMPTLVFHGLEDTALPSAGLNNTWDWIDADLTIVTAPGAGHFVQQDAAPLVSTTMLWWLRAHAR